MPCDNEQHNHTWPSSGTLVVEKCERYCAYCDIQREHEWKYAWFLRRHVRSVHCKPDGDHPDITVSEDWTDMPDKNRRDPITPHATPKRKKKNIVLGGKIIKKDPTTPSPKKRGKSISPRKHGSPVKYNTPVKHISPFKYNTPVDYKTPVKYNTPGSGITLGLTEASLDDHETTEHVEAQHDGPTEGIIQVREKNVKQVNMHTHGVGQTINHNNHGNAQEQQRYSQVEDMPSEAMVDPAEYLRIAFADSVQDLVSQGLAGGLSVKDIQMALVMGVEHLAGLA